MSTSVKYPGTGLDEADIPLGNAWFNIEDIFADDALNASVNMDPGESSHSLLLTNFAFTIPEDSVIQGVTVEMQRIVDFPNSAEDDLVELTGGIGTSDDKSSGSPWTNALTVVTYGGGSDLWGLTLGVDEVNSVNFGVRYRTVNNSGVDSVVAEIDYVKITVTYGVPGQAAIRQTRRIRPQAAQELVHEYLW